MKCQSLFSGINKNDKENIINLSSAELVQRVVKVNCKRARPAFALKGNGYTSKGGNSVKIVFCLPSEQRSTQKKKQFAPFSFVLGWMTC